LEGLKDSISHFGSQRLTFQLFSTISLHVKNASWSNLDWLLLEPKTGRDDALGDLMLEALC